MMKNILRKGLSVALCALVLALALSGVLFTCHCCSRAECAICAAIGEGLSLTRIMLAAVLTIAVALADALIRADAAAPSFAGKAYTLVNMRILMLD